MVHTGGAFWAVVVSWLFGAFREFVQLTTGQLRGDVHALALLMLTLVAQSIAAQVLPPPPTKPTTPNRLFVREFRFEGNSVYPQTELAKVTTQFTNRAITTEELEQARRAVTLYYIAHGYVNSGAIISGQEPTDGVITIRIVEGVLSSIEVHGNKWLRDSYIRGRVQRWSGPPLNVNELQEGLQLLRQNPNITQINAELKPATAPGDSLLDLRAVDQQPFRLGLQFDDERPSSVGALQIWALASDVNLTGNSDPLDLKYGIANSGPNGMEFSGLDNLEGSYLLPFTRFDTTLGLHASRLNTSIVEQTFLPLDITSLTTSYGVVLRQPVYQTADREAAVAVGFDHRWNDTSLLGERFNISPGAVNGETVVSVLRLSQEWIDRGQNHVLALRSTFNLGLDVLDATDNGVPGDPNGKFFSWVAQGQYIRRLFNTQSQLVLRAAGQWTAEPLLALEQFSVGGLETVRGYLENQLVRDRGIVSSAEFRVPIVFNKAGAGIVSLAPFFDFGGAWNVNGSTQPTTIYSTGMGLLVAPGKHLDARIYWGYRLRHVTMPAETDAQTLGLDFRVRIMAF